jgi:ATP synthase protein I
MTDVDAQQSADKQASAATDAERLQRLTARLQTAVAPAATLVGETAEERQETARTSRMATELVGAVLAGVGLGYLLDTQTGGSPYGVLAGLFLGFVAGVTNAWRAINGVDRAVGLRQKQSVSQAAQQHEQEQD